MKKNLLKTITAMLLLFVATVNANAEIISVDLKNDMVDALKANDINLFISRFDSLPYLLQRELLLFIAKSVVANEREEVIKRTRKDVEV